MVATNSLSAVIPQLLAQGLLALRENAIVAQLVNRQYEEEAGRRGSTIDVPIPSAIQAQEVAPSYVPPDDAGTDPSSVPIALDQWYEAAFFLTDKERLEVMEGYLPMQASSAIKAIANNVDSYILGRCHDGTGFYGFHGTPGTTPFASDTSDATACRRILSNQLAPLDDRRVVFNPDAEANALNLRAFQDASWSGSVDTIMKGRLNEKLGFRWFMDQNIPVHEAGTASGATTDADGYALGVKTVALDSAGSGTIEEGDIITFAGDSQTYVVTSGDDDVSDGGSISFEPGLKVAITTSTTAITVKGDHAVNLAFHRDAIAFANRPLEGTDDGLGAMIRSAVDPVSGLTLRLEVTRQHKRTRFAYDILYGARVVRRELGTRLAG